MTEFELPRTRGEGEALRDLGEWTKDVVDDETMVEIEEFIRGCIADWQNGAPVDDVYRALYRQWFAVHREVSEMAAAALVKAPGWLRYEAGRPPGDDRRIFHEVRKEREK